MVSAGTYNGYGRHASNAAFGHGGSQPSSPNAGPLHAERDLSELVVPCIGEELEEPVVDYDGIVFAANSTRRCECM